MFCHAHNALAIPRHFGVERFGLPHHTEWKPLSRAGIANKEPMPTESAAAARSDRWKFNGTLNDMQKKATEACMDSFDKHRGGILSLYCGAGKTVCALHLAATLRRKTLVVVGKSFLCDQWEERARHFLPAVRIGRIRQDVIDVGGRDVVIAMLQSLVARGEEYPTQDFGTVIVDECHHICARAFSRALFSIGALRHTRTRTPSNSGAGQGGGCVSGAAVAGKASLSSEVCLLGLSATPQRKDGLTDCLHWLLFTPHPRLSFARLSFVGRRFVCLTEYVEPASSLRVLPLKKGGCAQKHN